MFIIFSNEVYLNMTGSVLLPCFKYARNQANVRAIQAKIKTTLIKIFFINLITLFMKHVK